jgi:GNAT superfamily N-acetyltransferase
MTVRLATNDDLEALVAAYDWLFAPPGGPPPAWDPGVAAERLEAAIAGERSAVFVAGEPPAGFCTVYLDILSVRYGQRAWVEDLAVDSGRRSQGLGKALLDAARDWARERGASHLELDSSDARADAHRFYEREGPAWRSRAFGYLL